VFGLSPNDPRDVAIGQQWETVLALADHVLPMVYPSHYFPTHLRGVSRPNRMPYETVFTSVGIGMVRWERLRDAGVRPARVIPWLQAFNAPWVDRDFPYGPEQADAQIRAVYDVGLDDWVFWHPGSRYAQIAAAFARTATSRRQQFVPSADFISQVDAGPAGRAGRAGGHAQQVHAGIAGRADGGAARAGLALAGEHMTTLCLGPPRRRPRRHRGRAGRCAAARPPAPTQARRRRKRAAQAQHARTSCARHARAAKEQRAHAGRGSPTARPRSTGAAEGADGRPRRGRSAARRARRTSAAPPPRSWPCSTRRRRSWPTRSARSRPTR
jgi:hypothetical protein